jgi:hypothetical protein
MSNRILRVGVAGALAALLAACGGTDSAKAFSQDAFNTSFSSYMSAAGKNFDGFSADPALFGASECGVKNPGKPGAVLECKLGDGYDRLDDAVSAYNVQRDLVTKALPKGAREREEKNALYNTPIRFAAVSRKGAVILVLTKSGGKWVVGYIFQKAP